MRILIQYAPVSGIVKEVNEKLNDQPGLLNKSPEDDGELRKFVMDFTVSQNAIFFVGWLCRIQLSNPAEVDDLMTAEAYQDIQEP
jgi:glycine cleavage system H lipoate-binding protein